MANPIDSLKNIATAVQQHNQGVTGDTTSPWDRSANTGSAMKGVVTDYVASMKGLVQPLTTPGPDGTPRPPQVAP